jgi:hypothetical protein
LDTALEIERQHPTLGLLSVSTYDGGLVHALRIHVAPEDRRHYLLVVESTTSDQADWSIVDGGSLRYG